MSDDIVFIKNIEDYNNYKQLKPKRQYSSKRVKFICTKCNRLALLGFRNLEIPFLCISCKLKERVNTPEAKEKKRQTFLKKYGVENAAQSDIVKNKTKETNMQKYGEITPFKNNDIKEKIRQTCIKKYGVDNVAKSADIYKKIKRTCMEKYGAENPQQSDIVKNKTKETNLQKYGMEYVLSTKQAHEKARKTNIERYGVPRYSMLDSEKEKSYIEWLNNFKNQISQCNVDFIESHKHNVILKCKKCNLDFCYSRSHINLLLRDKQILCPHCRGKLNGISRLEKTVVEYVRSVYHGLIEENVKYVLGGRELDIYLPELRLGIEFDGTYWHADPRFYDGNFMIVNRTAAEIWKKDREKDILCEQKGIRLVRINEYDWLSNRRTCERSILSVLNSEL